MTARSLRWTPCRALSRSHGRRRTHSLPVATYGKIARECLPQATFEVFSIRGMFPCSTTPDWSHAPGGDGG